MGAAAVPCLHMYQGTTPTTYSRRDTSVTGLQPLVQMQNIISMIPLDS